MWEHVLCAQIARDGIVARVGNNRQRTALGHDLVDAHLHSGMHRADQHIDLVAFDQAVCVLRSIFRNFAIVIELDELHFPAAELAAFFREEKFDREGDVLSKLGERTRVGEHQPDLQRLCLTNGPAGWHRRGSTRRRYP